MTGGTPRADDVTPDGPAVPGDLFGLRSASFPDQPTITFSAGSRTWLVRPDFVRPHWLLLETLPRAIPVGECLVSVLGESGDSSRPITVPVIGGPRAAVRELYPGGASRAPFTVAFVANPAIMTLGGGIVRDPGFGDDRAFRRAVRLTLQSLLGMREDLLTRDGLEKEIRFVAVRDDAAAVEANALVAEYLTNVMMPRRRALHAFLQSRGVTADIAYAMQGSPTHQRVSAEYTTDDLGKGGTAYRLDGKPGVHGSYASLPGCIALTLALQEGLPLPMHEFAHALSDGSTARVIDAYRDATPDPDSVVNKKLRPQPGDPVPPQFATYHLTTDASTTYASDPTRDHVAHPPGYPAEWRSFHPELQDPFQPNLMDDYRLASVDAARCRFDRLTWQWLHDRLRAKVMR